MSKLCLQCCDRNIDTARFCRKCGAPWGQRLVYCVTPLAAIYAAWQNLPHMSAASAVREQLGAPAYVETEAHFKHGPRETWTYAYVIAGPSAAMRRTTGFVRFSAKSGDILQWSEPDWSLLMPDSAAPEENGRVA